MTEEQFKKGQEAFYSIKDVDSIMKEILQDESFITYKPPRFALDEAVKKDIQKIVKEHNEAIKKEVITCLNAHLARLQHDFEMI